MKAQNSDRTIHHLALSQISAGKYQPRTAQIGEASVAELAADIRANGIIDPLHVCPNGAGGTYDLLSGHRRFVAAALAGLDVAPCIIEDGLSEFDKWRIAGVENIQREDMSPLDEAHWLTRMADMREQETGKRPSQRGLAAIAGRTQGWVQQRLALLDAAPALQEVVTGGDLAFSDARKIISLPGEYQEAVTHYVVDNKARLTGTNIARLVDHVSRFIDPAPLDELITKDMEPDMRNALVALRYQLRGDAPEVVSAAAERLMNGSEDENEYLTRHTYRCLNDVTPLITLLDLMNRRYQARNKLEAERRLGRREHIVQAEADVAALDKEGWNAYTRDDWWKPEIARATGRICANCVWERCQPQAMPKSEKPVCPAWALPATRQPVSCMHCILEQDASTTLVPLGYGWPEDDPRLIRKDWNWYCRPGDYIALIGEKDARDSVQNAQAERSELDKNRLRIEQYRRVCELAADSLDYFTADHFQSQTCAKCVYGAYGWQHTCRFIIEPLERHTMGHYTNPDFNLFLLLEQGEDGDGKPVWFVDRAMPRCSMFRLLSLAPIAASGWRTFPPERKERQQDINVLTTLIRMSRISYSFTSGLDSPLNWLPYERDQIDQICNPERLGKYIQEHWNDLADGGVVTLFYAAASEAEMLHRNDRNKAFNLFNPETLRTERWLVVEWKTFIEGHEPPYWDAKMTWPFQTPFEKDEPSPKEMT